MSSCKVQKFRAVFSRPVALRSRVSSGPCVQGWKCLKFASQLLATTIQGSAEVSPESRRGMRAEVTLLCKVCRCLPLHEPSRASEAETVNHRHDLDTPWSAK